MYYDMQSFYLISSVLDISLTLEVYKTSEADGEMVVQVCKDKPIPYYYSVTLMITSVTVENATLHEGLPVPESDPLSPNRASEITLKAASKTIITINFLATCIGGDDFDSHQHSLVFDGSASCHHSHIKINNDNINEAIEEVFVVELTLESSHNPSLITLSRNSSLGIIIDDDRKLNQTFSYQNL